MCLRDYAGLFYLEAPFYCPFSQSLTIKKGAKEGKRRISSEARRGGWGVCIYVCECVEAGGPRACRTRRLLSPRKLRPSMPCRVSPLSRGGTGCACSQTSPGGRSWGWQASCAQQPPSLIAPGLLQLRRDPFCVGAAKRLGGDNGLLFGV